MTHNFSSPARSAVRVAVLPDHKKRVRSISTVLFASAAAFFVARAAWAQNPVDGLPPAPDATTIANKNAIAINIDGRLVDAEPAPVLQRGAVLVPLRGVLENLGAKVNYVAEERRIDIVQGTTRVELRIGGKSAVVDLKSVPLSAAPQIIGGATYVPLRSLAEIFGYRVSWIPASRTVAIYSREGTVRTSTDHRAALAAAGRFGIGIDFHDAEAEDVPRLLDAAKEAGAGLVRIRFDWHTLEPAKGTAFQWPVYDRVVREARGRGLVVVGVLGASAKWASIYSNSNDDFLWRNAPPRATEYASWQNYVRRTVGRYAGDVHTWQIWDKASSTKFRSTQRAYFNVLALAAKSAREADPKAILLAGEPGGVDLGWTELLASLPAHKTLNGVAVYPAAGWQPGRPAKPEEFLRPYLALRSRESGRNHSDLPVGGLEWPVAQATEDGRVAGASNADAARQAALLQTYTPQAQADYLMRASVLAYAAGAPQIFWNALRDDERYELIEPLNTAYGSGLLARDFTPRPSLAAYRTLVQQLKGKKFIGALATGPDVVALAFDNGVETTIAAWSVDGDSQLVLNSQGEDPGVPNSLLVPTRADAVVLDATGARLAGAEGAIRLTNRPVWITQGGAATATAARAAGTKLVLASAPETWTEEEGVAASFGAGAAGEKGIEWRKFRDFRAAVTTVSKDAEPGLIAEPAKDPLRPSDGKFFIFLDVDDDYLYFERGVPVDVTVRVRRLEPEVGAITPHEAGFNLEYDGARGTSVTPWQVVEVGEGWIEYKYRLPDASFANRGGYDLTINTFGSKRDLTFGGISIKKAAP